MHGNAKHTSGGLRKADLKYNSNGEIVSRRKSALAKRKENPALKRWRAAVKKVYKRPKYAGRFIAIKKVSAFYKAVKAEYEKTKTKPKPKGKAKKAMKSKK